MFDEQEFVYFFIKIFDAPDGLYWMGNCLVLVYVVAVLAMCKSLIERWNAVPNESSNDGSSEVHHRGARKFFLRADLIFHFGMFLLVLTMFPNVIRVAALVRQIGEKSTSASKSQPALYSAVFYRGSQIVHCIEYSIDSLQSKLSEQNNCGLPDMTLRCRLRDYQSCPKENAKVVCLRRFQVGQPIRLVAYTSADGWSPSSFKKEECVFQ